MNHYPIINQQLCSIILIFILFIFILVFYWMIILSFLLAFIFIFIFKCLSIKIIFLVVINFELLYFKLELDQDLFSLIVIQFYQHFSHYFTIMFFQVFEICLIISFKIFLYVLSFYFILLVIFKALNYFIIYSHFHFDSHSHSINFSFNFNFFMISIYFDLILSFNLNLTQQFAGNH
jgi:hypothetical protein